MTQELLYTSAPKGLKPGSRGFCTVVSTQGMAAPLASALESLSGYRPVFPHGDPRATENPVVLAHTKLTAGGRTYSVLSRIADYGLDYSQRTNKLAHHLVLDPAERPAGGPACALGQPGLMQTDFDGEPRILPSGRTIRPGDQPASICQTWRDMTGDAGWAGVLAEAFLSDPDRLVYLIFEPGMDLLPLLQEAIALLPAEHRWDVTFSTYFTNLPPGATCNWRCVLDGSPEAHQSRRFVQALRMNLGEDMGRAQGGPLVDAARTGRIPAGTALAPVRGMPEPEETPVPALIDESDPPPLPVGSAAYALQPVPGTPPPPPKRRRRTLADVENERLPRRPWHVAAIVAGSLLIAGTFGAAGILVWNGWLRLHGETLVALPDRAAASNVAQGVDERRRAVPPPAPVDAKPSSPPKQTKAPKSTPSGKTGSRTPSAQQNGPVQQSSSASAQHDIHQQADDGTGAAAGNGDAQVAIQPGPQVEPQPAPQVDPEPDAPDKRKEVRTVALVDEYNKLRKQPTKSKAITVTTFAEDVKAESIAFELCTPVDFEGYIDSTRKQGVLVAFMKANADVTLGTFELRTHEYANTKTIFFEPKETDKWQILCWCAIATSNGTGRSTLHLLHDWPLKPRDLASGPLSKGVTWALPGLRHETRLPILAFEDIAVELAGEVFPFTQPEHQPASGTDDVKLRSPELAKYLGSFNDEKGRSRTKPLPGLWIRQKENEILIHLIDVKPDDLRRDLAGAFTRAAREDADFLQECGSRLGVTIAPRLSYDSLSQGSGEAIRQGIDHAVRQLERKIAEEEKKQVPNSSKNRNSEVVQTWTSWKSRFLAIKSSLSGRNERANRIERLVEDLGAAKIAAARAYYMLPNDTGDSIPIDVIRFDNTRRGNGSGE